MRGKVVAAPRRGPVMRHDGTTDGTIEQPCLWMRPKDDNTDLPQDAWSSEMDDSNVGTVLIVNLWVKSGANPYTPDTTPRLTSRNFA